MGCVKIRAKWAALKLSKELNDKLLLFRACVSKLDWDGRTIGRGLLVEDIQTNRKDGGGNSSKLADLDLHEICLLQCDRKCGGGLKCPLGRKRPPARVLGGGGRRADRESRN